MLEKIKKHPMVQKIGAHRLGSIIAIVLCFSIIVSGLLVFHFRGQQHGHIKVGDDSKTITHVSEKTKQKNKVEETKIEEKKEEPKQKVKQVSENNLRYKVGNEVEMEIPQYEGSITFKGKVINTYSETGTVIMSGFPWRGVLEFGYINVVDVHATSYNAVVAYEPEEGEIDLNIRAVLTNDNKLIPLRDLNAARGTKIGPAYKIIDKEHTGALEANELAGRKCSTIPTYIYDFLVENKLEFMCEA